MHHAGCMATTNLIWFVARPARLERATCGFVVRRSIHLSYGRLDYHSFLFRRGRCRIDFNLISHILTPLKVITHPHPFTNSS